MPGKPLRGDHHGAFVEGRHELGSDKLERSERQNNQHQRDNQKRLAVVLALPERSAVTIAQRIQPGGALRRVCGVRLLRWTGVRCELLCTMPQRNRAERRNDKQRQQQGAGKSGDDGDRHRPKHPAFETLQGEHRKIDRDDDEHAEDDRTRNLLGCVADHLEKRSLGVSGFKPVHAVFDHDHRSIDDGAEVDGAQAHEVNGDAEQIHADEAEQQRERDRNGNHQGSAPVAQEEKQNDQHQAGGGNKVTSNRGRRGIDGHRTGRRRERSLLRSAASSSQSSA